MGVGRGRRRGRWPPYPAVRRDNVSRCLPRTLDAGGPELRGPQALAGRHQNVVRHLTVVVEGPRDEGVFLACEPGQEVSVNHETPRVELIVGPLQSRSTVG